ncbi:hypothetical protein ACWPOB_27030, partial [Rhodococcus sp. 2H158]
MGAENGCGRMSHHVDRIEAMMLLCSVKGFWGSGGGEQAEDFAGNGTFEAADDLAGAFAFRG